MKLSIRRAFGDGRTVAMVATLAFFAGTGFASAQVNVPAQASTHPTFEVATLKRSSGPSMCIVPERNGDRFTCHGAPLIPLIAYAYNVPYSRIEITGGGGYSVDAKDRSVRHG